MTTQASRPAKQAAHDALLQGAERVVSPVAAQGCQQIGLGIHGKSIRLRGLPVHLGFVTNSDNGVVSMWNRLQPVGFVSPCEDQDPTG